ncbi:I78 family peptidase inhibitor [Lysobacter capsici]|uniref:I78 family peptidase inhibitor n=1 Tax=Lysobacter capsici TaxID=435897 RepID=UPI000BBB19DD|nr:I78 family peptidase inhibitor [Lysobacter capsici]ATE74092.1 hypothetical protein CNO08_23665 [Lysobacter capsici]
MNTPRIPPNRDHRRVASPRYTARPAFMRRTRRRPQARGTDPPSSQEPRHVPEYRPSHRPSDRRAEPRPGRVRDADSADQHQPGQLQRRSRALGRSAARPTKPPSSAPAPKTGSRSVRVLKPGMAATMDFQQDRLNIDVNERGAITGLRCG